MYWGGHQHQHVSALSIQSKYSSRGHCLAILSEPSLLQSQCSNYVYTTCLACFIKYKFQRFSVGRLITWDHSLFSTLNLFFYIYKQISNLEILFQGYMYTRRIIKPYTNSLMFYKYIITNSILLPFFLLLMFHTNTQQVNPLWSTLNLSTLDNLNTLRSNLLCTCRSDRKVPQFTTVKYFKLSKS